MTELVETIYHWHAGQGLRTIVKSLGISRNTVRKYTFAWRNKPDCAGMSHSPAVSA